MNPSPDALFNALAATWPAAEVVDKPPFLLRRGAGGGKRVSAASANGNVTEKDIAQAEAAMLAIGQPPLFRVTGAGVLDDLLALRGYCKIDESVLRVCPIGPLAGLPLPRLSVFDLWEPLQIMRDIWAEGGLGPARVAVMERVQGPKTALLARLNGRAVGAAFVAMHGEIAMVHAVETLIRARRQGAGRHMMIAAARWAEKRGATHLALAVTKANTGANALYQSLSMPIYSEYHYRIRDAGFGALP